MHASCGSFTCAAMWVLCSGYDNSTEACDGTSCYRRCLDNGAPYPVGVANPNNNCQVCSDSTLRWESRAEGTECGVGKYCDGQSRCIDGCVLEGRVYPRARSCEDGNSCNFATYCENACLIDGKAYPRGTPNPSNPCQLCLSANPKGWTSAPKGSPCNEYGKNSCDGSGSCVSAISIGVGNSFTCGVTSAGAAKCWGVNDHGQLGNGSTKDSQTPVQVSGLGSGVSVVVPMTNRACAITTGGDAWCWGSDVYGHLSAPAGDKLVPVKVSSGVRAIGGSTSSSCAITNTGSVTCTRFGAGFTDTQFGHHSDILSLTHGGLRHICALSSTESVWCWDGYGSPTEKRGMPSNVTSLAAGWDHTCALGSAGSVICWGDNAKKQLGNATNYYGSAPVPVSGLSSGVKGIAAAGRSTCAIMASGSVKCWGEGKYGNIGPAYTVNKNVPVDVGALGSGAWVIDGSHQHYCTITDKNAVKCWGWKYTRGGSGEKGWGYLHQVWTVAGFP